MLETLLEKQWHHLSLNEVLALLETDADQGLDAFEVTHRQKQFGPNSFTLMKAQAPSSFFSFNFINRWFISFLQPR